MIPNTMLSFSIVAIIANRKLVGILLDEKTLVMSYTRAYLKDFGCIAYALILIKSKTKLDPRVTKIIFL